MEARNILVEYGLSEKEAKVYLVLLRIGSAKAERIAKSAEIPRTTAYNVLKSLNEKGLVSFVKKERGSSFEATDPKNILLFLEEKYRQIKEILPQLEKIRGSALEKPEIEIREGKNAIKSVYRDVIKTGKELKIIGNYHYFKEILHYSAEILIKQRIASSINCRFIGEKSKDSMNVKRKDRKEMRKTLFIKNLNDVKAECYVYGNKVALLTLVESEPIAVIVKNSELAKLMNVVFENIWSKIKY